MKKFVFLILFSASALGLFGQKEQWADSVIAYSSSFGVPYYFWSAEQALGANNAWPSCGDIVYAWASSTPDATREFLVVHFETPAPPEKIEIYESWNAGAIDTVYVRKAGTNMWTEVYQATASGVPCQILTINVAGIAFNIDAIRIAINSPAVLNWNEIDAVKLTSPPPVVSISNKSIFEGNAGITKIKLNVSLNYPSDSIVTVKFHTEDGTATIADNDYTQIVNRKLTFNPGQTSKKATINIIGDVVDEPNDQFYVVLSNPQNSTIGNISGTATIKDDDLPRTDNNLDAIHPISIWPNPATDVLHIAGLSTEMVAIEIIDIQGRKLLTKMANSLNSDIDISTLESGIYLLSYYNGLELNTIRFMVD